MRIRSYQSQCVFSTDLTISFTVSERIVNEFRSRRVLEYFIVILNELCIPNELNLLLFYIFLLASKNAEWP